MAAAELALYLGMYDGTTVRPPHVRLLNPAFDDEDPTGRRFSLLEID